VSFAGILLISYAVLGIIILLPRLRDYDRTINQGYPPGQEVQVNFWTRKPTQVSGIITDKQDRGR
jgi:hypothetical protein